MTLYMHACKHTHTQTHTGISLLYVNIGFTYKHNTYTQIWLIYLNSSCLLSEETQPR